MDNWIPISSPGSDGMGGAFGCECDACRNGRRNWTAAQERIAASTSPTITGRLTGTALTGQITGYITTDFANTAQNMNRVVRQNLVPLDSWVTTSTSDLRDTFWMDEATASMAMTATVAPAGPSPEERAEMTRVQRLRDFAARGITAIPESECTDKGTYVIWNKYDPTCELIVMSPDDILYQFDTLESVAVCSDRGSERQLNRKLHAHPTKPVRIVGMYRRAGTVFKYYVPRNTSYQYARNSRGAGSTSTWRNDSFGTAITNDGLDTVPATIHTLTREERQGYMAALIEAAYARSGSYGEMTSRMNAMKALFAPRTQATTVPCRGTTVHYTEYKQARRTLAAIGEMIRDHSDYSAYGIVEEFNNLPSQIQGRVQGNIVDAWNGRAWDEVRTGACGHMHAAEDGHEVARGQVVCAACFEDDYVECENTGAYEHRDNVYLHDDDCYYTYQQYDEDDDEDRDEDEDENNVGGLVRGYSTNVLELIPADRTVTVSTYGEFLMGIELEVQPGRRMRSETVRHTQKELANGYAIMKNDGSLNDGGFEIVTAPRKLADHIAKFKAWKPHSDLTAWDAGVCGMHVHISSGAFSAVTLGKFIEFINAQENDDMIESIAGRHPRKDGQCKQYCQRDGKVVAANPKMTLDGKSQSRYHMVNTCNNNRDSLNRLGLTNHESGRPINTIELRIFRATLKKSRLLAQIEFAHAAVMFCRFASMRELRQEHFITWLRKSAGMYPHLAKWFGVRENTQTVNFAPKVREEAEV